MIICEKERLMQSLSQTLKHETLFLHRELESLEVIKRAVSHYCHFSDYIDMVSILFPRMYYLEMIRVQSTDKVTQERALKNLEVLKFEMLQRGIEHRYKFFPIANKSLMIALDYVLEGSVQGTKVLTRFWSKKFTTNQMSSILYYNHLVDQSSEVWPNIKLQIDSYSTDIDLPQTVIQDAKKCFRFLRSGVEFYS